MFDEEKFREVLKAKNKSLQDIADILNINLATLYRKMNGTSDFFRSEMDILVKELEIEDPKAIFFA